MKEKEEVRIEGRPVFYAVLYNDFKKAALELGYTLAMHGSMHSDMDLIAVAWVQDAKPVEELVKALNDRIGTTVWKEYNLKKSEIKPHGRISFTLSIMGDWVIDLSVIPPVNQSEIDYKKTLNEIQIIIPDGFLKHLAETLDNPVSVVNKFDFAKEVLFALENKLGDQEGLTGFQKLVEEAMEEVFESGSEAVELPEN